MRLSEHLGFGPKPFLFERPTETKYDEDLNRWTVGGPISLEAWVRQTFDRGRSIRGVFRSFRGREERWLDHILEGIEFVGRMEVADLASNGLRGSVLWDNRDHTKPSEFGKILTRAYNNPVLADHNHEHSRRHERWLESMFLNIGELRHSHSVFMWIDSALLFSYWHDVDQLMSLERNLMGSKDLPVKRGHALGAAVMILALHNRYAIERKVSIHRAWEICAGAALMIARHDKPEGFADGLTGTAMAYHQLPDGTYERIKGEDLKHAFDTNELDLFSMAPSQLMELLREEKAQYGFVETEDSWGLHPAFEEEYRHELTSLAKNTIPILKDVTPQERMSYRYAAEAAVLADVFDMVSPPTESIFRTLNTQISRGRPFFRTDMGLEAQLAHIGSDIGNIDPGVDSDVRRMFWELVHMEHIKDGITADSPFVRSINRETAIMGALAFKDIGMRIMRGDLSDIDTLYHFRKAQVARKTLAKAGYSKVRRLLVYQSVMKTGDDAVVIELLEKKGNGTLLRRYRDKVHNLDIEAQRIRDGLLQKPDSDGRDLRVYEESDRKAFAALADSVIKALSEKYSVSVGRLKRYRARVVKRSYPTVIPYRTYDSLGGTPRTLVAPLAPIESGLGVAGNEQNSYYGRHEPQDH